MDVNNCIKTRRSRRKYIDKEVSNKVIGEIIDSARYAPSSRDSQPWEFIIIRDDDTKERLAKLKGEDNKECILGSNVIIAVCVDNEKSKNRWVEDGVCAAINILLSAHSLGFGAVYVTGYTNKNPRVTMGIKRALKLPKNIIPVVLIPIGYPDPSEEIERKELREIDEMVHFSKW